jgi:hypothetical protein
MHVSTPWNYHGQRSAFASRIVFYIVSLQMPEVMKQSAEVVHGNAVPVSINFADVGATGSLRVESRQSVVVFMLDSVKGAQRPQLRASSDGHIFFVGLHHFEYALL